jgi:hypothetical protein
MVTEPEEFDLVLLTMFLWYEMLICILLLPFDACFHSWVQFSYDPGDVFCKHCYCSCDEFLHTHPGHI